eukprot:gene8298-14259_t
MGVFSDVLVCTFVLATFLGNGDCRKAKSKVVFVTLSFESSPYFNCLELAEELVRRGLEVFLDSCFAMLKNKNVLKEIKDADMIVTISVMPCGHYIADMYDKPTIALHPASFSPIASETGVPSLASFVPMITDTFFVGSFLTKPSKQLPEDLEGFMQSSGEHGVVLLAFGSAVCSMDQIIVERILTAISRMKQKFIWKLKSLKWVPQNDKLGHEKTKAFVSHMGINGAAEAAYHGVPIVAVPFIAERLHNTIMFSKKMKMAKIIDIKTADAETWQRTIEEVIYNSSYKEHAMMTSKRLRSWPKSGTERAGDLVQYALDNGGRLPHLKSNANTLYWFQYYCVDVITLLLALAVLLPLVIFKMLKFLLSLLWRSTEKSKKD